MITFSSLQLRRGIHLLLDRSQATIHTGQKVGLVGKNGTGKSTLFALIKGEITVDAGEVSFPKTWTLAWVNQETPALDRTAIEYVIDGDREFRLLAQQLSQAEDKNDGNKMAMLYAKLDAIDAWSIQARAAVLLAGLGFQQSELTKPIRHFSGGWRMRLNLAQALICRSDLLLLDEPTNHLDLETVVWLEKWLKSYSGTLLLISHDRDFLDSIVDKIIHIEQKQLVEYTGNYSAFEIQRVAKLAQQQFLYEQQQRRIAHLKSYIDRFSARAATAKQAQSRAKIIEKMEKLAPIHADNPFQFSFPALDSLPNPLLKLQQAEVGYNSHAILSDINLYLTPTSRIGLLGLNGAGKSTLIKLLTGELSPLSGMIHYAKGLNIGYFAQHQLDAIEGESSALVQIRRIADNKITEQKLRDYLGRFGFHGDKVYEPITTFSGGERARLVLALLIWKKPNLLLLDEPTNHLDLDMREALTQALLTFDGALVVVSHDRHLLRSIVDEFYLVTRGKVLPFKGELANYQDSLLNTETTSLSSIETAISQPKQKKRQDSHLRRETQKLTKAISLLEKQLEQLQSTQQITTAQLSDPSIYDMQYSDKLKDLLQQQQQQQLLYSTLEQQWFSHQTALEKLTEDV